MLLSLRTVTTSGDAVSVSGGFFISNIIHGLSLALSRQFRRELDRRNKAAALTVLVKCVVKRFPVDQKFQMPDSGSLAMRMGISDSVHHTATGAVDISGCVLLTAGPDAELFPRLPT